jgi:MFS superfamily sulfate permease-like transporter
MAYAAVADVPPTYSVYASRTAPALAVASGGSHLLFTSPVGVTTVLVLGSLRHFALTEDSRHQRHPAAVARSLASIPVT